MSHDAYRRNQSSMARPRDAEYLIFSKITAQLIAVEESARDDLKALANAIHENRLLWGALANDCAHERNQLPKATRAAIIDLDKFVQAYSRDIIRKRESAKPLIDINRMIMDGLAGREVAMAQ